ncbi:MAG: FAD/NAD(P)-binding oxidoreductase [Thermoplasmatales archaeon]|nr:FAD/NAD(P)-binding oxidoreductase [Thermoplasmatales archaeon]
MQNDRFECNYLIIGSGVSSYFAIRELLSIEKNSKIIVVTEDHEYPYDRPPLSKEYLRDQVRKESLFFMSQDYYMKNNLKVILGNRVTNIDPVEKVAYLERGESIKFDKALIATGGSPRRAGIKGEDKKGVHYLRSLADADSIKEELSFSKKPLIIGGGFIGVEIAASMATLGKKPTIVEKRSYIWGGFLDKHVSALIKEYFEKKGVAFRLEDSIREFLGEEKIVGAVTEEGKLLERILC